MKLCKGTSCEACGGTGDIKYKNAEGLPVRIKCEGCNGEGVRYVELSPAELAREGLGYKAVVEELKNQMIGAKKGFELSGDTEDAQKVHDRIPLM